jgi:hypothetical protein
MTTINGELLQLYQAERTLERDRCVHAVLAEPDDEPDMSWETRHALQEAKARIIERIRRMP